jgi:(1->4)-alpha-D-glucan 1-alpha-D-glucosylmutase
MLSKWDDGRIKLAVTQRALRFRRAESELFERGDYLDLAVHGPVKERLMVIARRLGDSWAAAAIPRLTAGLLGFPPRTYAGEAAWTNMTVTLPDDAPDRWYDVLTGSDMGSKASDDGRGKHLPLAAVLGTLPLALLAGQRRVGH